MPPYSYLRPGRSTRSASRPGRGLLAGFKGPVGRSDMGLEKPFEKLQRREVGTISACSVVTVWKIVSWQ